MPLKKTGNIKFNLTWQNFIQFEQVIDIEFPWHSLKTNIETSVGHEIKRLNSPQTVNSSVRGLINEIQLILFLQNKKTHWRFAHYNWEEKKSIRWTTQVRQLELWWPTVARVGCSTYNYTLLIVFFILSRTGCVLTWKNFYLIIWKIILIKQALMMGK